jgi:hypothetical protein
MQRRMPSFISSALCSGGVCFPNNARRVVARDRVLLRSLHAFYRYAPIVAAFRIANAEHNLR